VIVVAHRRNTVAELDATPPTLGIEVDVRERGGRLVVVHDAFAEGTAFDGWLDHYRHALLVVNTKEEGLIAEVLRRLADRGVDDAFLLGPDPGEALPWLDAGERRIAVRVSEVHHPGTAHALAGRAGWVWLDAFHDGFPVDADVVRALKADGYRICLVSPELYGRDPASIPRFRALASATGVAFDAVCTRRWDDWR
jgi:hypothetical protein